MSVNAVLVAAAAAATLLLPRRAALRPAAPQARRAPTSAVQESS